MNDLQLCFTKLAEVGYNSPSTASLLAHIARLSGVELELLSSDIEGVLNAIAEVNFKVRSKKEEIRSENVLQEDQEEQITLEDYQYQLVTSLVNAELAVDLESALKIASELPYKDVEGYLKARIKFLNRDKEEEERQEKERQKIGESIASELNDGTFFGKGFSNALSEAIDGENKGLAGLL